MKSGFTLLLIWPFLISSLLASGFRDLDRSETMDPDPNIFDGTQYENWEREPQSAQMSRVGETSYGKTLEGKENEVAGWDTGEKENPSGEESAASGMAGQGGGPEQDPEEQGGGGIGGEDHTIEVEQPEQSGGGGAEETEEQESGGMGGDSQQSAGSRQNQMGGGGGNPIELLKSISQSAQAKRKGKGGMEGEYAAEGNDENATFGNNPYHLEQRESPDVVGSIEIEEEGEEQTSESSARSSAAGRQETSEQQRGGREVGDELPSGI